MNAAFWRTPPNTRCNTAVADKWWQNHFNTSQVMRQNDNHFSLIDSKTVRFMGEKLCTWESVQRTMCSAQCVFKTSGCFIFLQFSVQYFVLWYILSKLWFRWLQEHVKCHSFLSDFNKNLSVWTNVSKMSHTKFYEDIWTSLWVTVCRDMVTLMDDFL